MNIVWWRFLTPAQRAERAADLEALLRGRLDAAAEPGLKSTWFGALRNVATTPADGGLAARAVAARDGDHPACRWSRPMRRRWPMRWPFAGSRVSSDVLDAQRDRITNPDRKARFEFVRGAASADAGERERWFRALARPRRPSPRDLGSGRAEAVERSAAGTGVRAAGAQGAGHAAGRPPDRRAVLRCRLGRATLSGYSTPQVAAMVTKFVDTLPADYPPRLRAKVLQSSDLLMRAARVKEH